ncbi:MAG: PAS domain S-box protein [Anaerolineales bacterium]|nr:PAS domain S-box protein [Anaerolineales bacterium]
MEGKDVIKSISANEPVALQNINDQTKQRIVAIPRISSIDDLYHDTIVNTLLESLAEGLIITNSDGNVVLVNKRTETLFGYSRDEVIGQPLDTYLPVKSIEIHAEHMREYFANPRTRPMGQGMDLIGRRRDGTIFPVEISLSYFDTGDGPLAIAFVTDISRRKAAEKALEQRNEELDAFAHMVAHDLNASLSTIVGYSEMLLEIHDSISSEEMHEYLTNVARNGRKMANIIHELLLFATVRQGEVPLQPLDMTKIVREVLLRLQYAIGQEKAEIVQPDSFPRIQGYGPWVEEVWYNYINNAIKYGGSPPRIELGYTELDEGSIKFWVKDNGVGIKTELLETVFLPLGGKKLPIMKGHGLGLSIVKRIVEKIGGTVNVESQEQKGSIFSFTLPGPESA